MRKRYLLLLSLSALSAAAVTLDVPRLPAPDFADKEVSGDVPLPANRLALMRTFLLELTFDSTPSNNVQVAFGRDNRPADGALAAEETDFIIGWDCGEWFLRPQGLKERHACTPQVSTGRRTLAAAIRVNDLGVPLSAAFTDGDAPLAFSGLASPPFPDWLKPALWTHLRVTVRGADIPAEAVKVKFAPDGAIITIK